MADTRVSTATSGLCTILAGGSVVGLSDAQLLDRYLARPLDGSPTDRAAEVAFEALIARHGPMVMGVCRRRLQNPADVQDAFQATFIVLARRAHAVRVEGSLGRWLYGVAFRVSAKARVRRSRLRTVALEVEPTASEPEPTELLAALDEELNRLPTKYRLPIVLCYFEGLTYTETAERLAWPVGTVNGRLVKARALLRDRLTRRGLAVPTAGLVVLLTEEARSAVPEALKFQIVRWSIAAQETTMAATVAGLIQGELMTTAWWKTGAISLLIITASGIGIFARTTASHPQPVTQNSPVSQKPPEVPRAAQPVGFVCDLDEKPVSGATVVIGQFSGGKPNHRILTTDADGRFDLTPPEGMTTTQYAMAFQAGFAPTEGLLVRIREKNIQDLRLHLGPAETFDGLVTNLEGKPVAAASVQLRTVRYPGSDGKEIYLSSVEAILRGTPLERLFFARTDDQGRFRFPAIPRGGKAALRVSSPGMGEYYSDNRRQGDQGYVTGTLEAPALVVLEPEARIEGKVVTRMPNVAVGGLSIYYQGTNASTRMWGETRTDAAGNFKFEGMGSGSVNVFPADDNQPGPWTYEAVADLEVKAGQTRPIEIELIPGVLVEGRVVHGIKDPNGVVFPTDEPIAGVSIGVYGPARPQSGAAILYAKTDQAGRYRFRLPPGMTTIYVSQQDRGGSFFGLIPDEPATFTVPDIVSTERERIDRIRKTR